MERTFGGAAVISNKPADTLALPATVVVVRLAVRNAFAVARTFHVIPIGRAARFGAASAFPFRRATAPGQVRHWVLLALPVPAAPVGAHLCAAVDACISRVALANATFAFAVVVAIIEACDFLAVGASESNVTMAFAFEAVSVAGARFPEALVLARFGIKTGQVRGVLGQRGARKLASFERSRNIITF